MYFCSHRGRRIVIYSSSHRGRRIVMFSCSHRGRTVKAKGNIVSCLTDLQKGCEDAVFIYCFSFLRHRKSGKGIIQVSLKSPPIFQKYMILITIIWISEHSTAIANKRLGALPDARFRSPLLICLGRNKKEDVGPRQDARGDKKKFFWPNVPTKQFSGLLSTLTYSACIS